MALHFSLHAAGVLAPGIGSLADLLASSRSGRVPAAARLELPSPAELPANERRRASPVVRLTMACAAQALQASPLAADTLRMVFASDDGTGEVAEQMLDALTTHRLVSPSLFHNSVHNAPSGYLSIGYQNHQSATSVSLGPDSFAAGLLCAVGEACTSGQPVLLLAYDAAMTGALAELLPITDATASAWIISSVSASESVTGPGDTPLASFGLTLHPAPALPPGGPAPTGAMPGPALPAWMPAAWSANASARGIAALALLEAPGDRPGCELPLGAQWLRLERLAKAPAC